MRTKIKAMRDEFTSRQTKIADLTTKIKDLSLFKLEIESDIRGVLQDNFSNVDTVALLLFTVVIFS